MLKTKRFNKRYYHSFGEIFRDTSAIMKRRSEVKSLMRGNVIGDAFRERIMLAVTEVNGCRYCQYAHAKMALKSGLTKDEIESMADGVFHHCPPEEVPALLYAQHWAEMNGKPDRQARQKVIDTYGEQAVSGMELAMRMIRMGNLMGNTWDYILFKISFGHWGNKAK